MNRRGFLHGILVASVAPVFIKSEILMPVKKLCAPLRAYGAELSLEIDRFSSGLIQQAMQVHFMFDERVNRLFVSNGFVYAELLSGRMYEISRRDEWFIKNI